MEFDQPWTPVIFRHLQGEVIALFIQDPGTLDPYTCMAYAHIGQHGSADPVDVIRNTLPVSLAECKSLLNELQGVGYRLFVRTRLSPLDLEVRRRKLKEFLDGSFLKEDV